MPFRTEQHITRQMMRREPKTLFVFGDNAKHVGLGGQAQQMRGEPNAVGIITKWLPARTEEAFFKDADYDTVRPFIQQQFDKLGQHLYNGCNVVWPVEGIGTGLAELEKRAPRIYAMITAGRAMLEASTLPNPTIDPALTKLPKLRDRK